MSIQSLFQGLKQVIRWQKQNAFELWLFSAGMKDRERLRRSPQADFFLEISAQIAGKSDQEIHSYFDQYTEHLSMEFANWLDEWGKARLIDSQRLPKIEAILDAFDTIGDFPRGNRASNVEISLVANQLELLFINRTNDSQSWAMTQNNLAIAYRNRIRGDRAENIEKSIEHYKSALEIRTKKDLPIDWATTQNNLVIAYKNRIRGDRAENLEKSIECYENALPIIASSSFLQDLENLNNDLANAYLRRVNSDTTLNHDLNQNDRTNQTLQQLTQTCLAQNDWYKASLSFSLWSKALVSQTLIAQAIQPSLQALNLDIQHNHQLIDTDLQELARLVTQLDWPPTILPSQWQTAASTLPSPTSPLTPQLQAQICFTIGVISIQENYWYKGLDWLKACWEIHQQLNDLSGLAEVSYQLAIGHHIASNLSYAGIYYRDAQRIFRHLGDRRKVAFCHHGLGRLLLQIGKIEPAITEFNQALTIYQTIPNLPQIESRIGDIHYYQGVIKKMQDPTLTHQSL